MKHYLLISGSFTSANFYVMVSVIRSLGEVHIHAISANNEKETSLPEYPDVTYYHVYNWRKAFLSALKRHPVNIVSKAVEYVFCKVTAIYDTITTSFYEKKIYADSKEIVANNNVEGVFSVCLPFYTHRIATKLQRELKVKWYQFWVDPYSNRNNGGRLWKRAAEIEEKRFLKRTLVIYTLPEVFVGSPFLDMIKSKLVSFEIPYLENRKTETLTKDVIFAGGFLKRVREPYPVLNILMTILEEIDNEVKFLFYVRCKEEFTVFTERSGGRILFHDYISHEDLYKVLGNSYMLLNIGNAGSIQMPSKTVEYVSFRKPLLFFYKDKNDPSLRYLKNYPDICRINVDDNLENNKNKIVEFFNKEHEIISYQELMKVKEYRESTPEHIKKMLITQL